MEEGRGGGQDPYMFVAPAKKRKNDRYINNESSNVPGEG
jgi:hypothetical protein